MIRLKNFMTFDKNLIKENLIELNNIYGELLKYKDIKEEDFVNNISIRWIIERGLLGGINLILDIGNHILASEYKIYPATYEDILKELFLKGILSQEVYLKIKGMGSFRNILAHEYIKIDPRKVYQNYQKFLEIFPELLKELLKLT
ncbi:MAG: type VII toxin-antitoxin system HepT family RNase toxin [Dictyoglomaceae bacterium]